MIVTLAGQKGGSGKSTLSIHLAAEWMRRGRRVLLIDTDPQGTSLTWSNIAAERGHPAPTVVAMGDNLRQAVPELSASTDITVIDTAGRLGKRTAGALMIADLVLLPCQPNPPDIWAMADTIETIQMTQQVRPDLRAALVINGKESRTVLGRSAREALTATELPVLMTEVSHRIAFAEACAIGKGVTLYAPKSPAAAELQALADEIEALTGVEAAA
jgi:chromosome partitioning protein